MLKIDIYSLRAMWTPAFSKTPLLGILRGLKPEEAEPVVELCARRGLAAVEVTLNTEGALGLIERMRKAADGRMLVGAGTVLSLGAMRDARAAGAEFVVSPVFVPESFNWLSAPAPNVKLSSPVQPLIQ